MLHNNKTQPIAGAATSASDVVSPAEVYAVYAAFVRRQFPIIAVVMFIVLALAVIYLLTTPIRYTGHAELVIDSHKLSLFQQQNPLGVDAPVDTAMVDSQVEVLKSENVALAVIRDLHLIKDAEFVGPTGGLIGTVLDGISSVYSTLFGNNQPETEFTLTRKALRRFESRLTIKRVGLTYVINVDYESLHPERAAQIANAVAHAYLADSLQAKEQSTTLATDWLEDRLHQLRAQATAADRAEVDYKAKNDIVDTGGRLLNEQQLAELNSSLIVARDQTAEAQAKLTRVQQILDAETESPDFNQTATVADTLHDDVITRLRQQYLDLAARESDWSARYGQDHEAVIKLRNQMTEIRRSIDDELNRIAETYKSDYDIAKAREEAVRKGLDDIVADSNKTNKAEIDLRELDSTAQGYRAVADNFLQQYTMSVQQQSLPITDARLITVAAKPLQPSHPKTWLVLAIAVFGGAFAGIGIGVIRDFSDRVFRSGSQIEADLEVDCIAVMPRIKDGEQHGFLPRVANDVAPYRGREGRNIVRGGDLLWHTVDSPFSRFTEGVRAIKMAADANRANKVFAVTSSLPNEGKSTVATALALLIAQGGARVILVDADLRNPSLSRELAPGAEFGLLDALSNKMALGDVVWIDPLTRLQFLPAIVTRTQLAHTSELLGSPAIERLFEQLRDEYDYVIVDLSPLAPVVDARATLSLIDSYVFVVEWGRTKVATVHHALGAARRIYDRVLGFVLNKADYSVLSRYEDYLCQYYGECSYYSSQQERDAA
jgi:succinoglycan biosynthesis transport protein ExoP